MGVSTIDCDVRTSPCVGCNDGETCKVQFCSLIALYQKHLISLEPEVLNNGNSVIG